jgi:hypothetical protein
MAGACDVGRAGPLGDVMANKAPMKVSIPNWDTMKCCKEVSPCSRVRRRMATNLGTEYSVNTVQESVVTG